MLDERFEYRFAEAATADDGRIVSGTLIRYGDVAALPWGQEKISPGAFGPVEGRGDILLNLLHDRRRPLARAGRALSLAGAADAITVRADLPNTRDADDALELLRTGVITGFSVEMAVTRQRVEGRTRIIEQAELRGLALVEKPAYPKSQIAARWLPVDPPAITVISRWR